MDFSKPLTVTISFNSPHAVSYRFWYKKPGDAKYTIFATGTDNEYSNSSIHTHVVGPLPSGSELVYLVWFSGNEYTAYDMELALSQEGVLLPGYSFSHRNTTGSDGFAQEKHTITLV